MIAYFILGLCLLFGFLFLARWFVSAEPRKVLSVGRWVLGGVGLLGAGYLLWGGRQALAALILPLLLPLVLRWRGLWRRLKAAAGPGAGQESEVRTRFLRMTLDHDTGIMSGVVLEGRFRGRALEELRLDSLVELWRECRVEDAQSAAVLEAYLDRTQGSAWRDAAQAGPGGAAGAGAGPGPAPRDGMSREEAYQILGLDPGAGPEDVQEAHRRLMQKVHPDRGGSNYLAAKINQAKELLLKD